MTTDTEPDFYMGSSEDVDLETPRRCWRLKRLSSPHRDDFLVVRVDPPIPGEALGVDGEINVIIVAARIESYSLFPINTFPAKPVPVHVLLPLVKWEDRTELKANEFSRSLSWAELYPSEREARAKMTYQEAKECGKII